MIVRIPPSPTGHLHLGTARTALFNYLFAKKNNAKMLFRWEDTDKERSETQYETEILEGLKWLGMDFETEAEISRQTDNTEAHEAALKMLWADNKIFPCFVTPDEINQRRTAAQKAKQNFVFWSDYRDTPKEELQAKIDADERYVWRLRAPKDREIIFQDLIHGETRVNAATLGDFVVARGDGSVLYLLANTVNDQIAGVTHIIRGDDHISNTPKQLLLWEALDAQAPEYAHIPLIMDLQGKKLSKRNVQEGVCVLVSDFQKEGFLPEAVVNGLAFLGWNPKTTDEFFNMQDLIDQFDLAKVNKAAAKYDFEKMRWFNGLWISKMSLEQYNALQNTDISNQKAFAIAQEKAKSLPELEDELSYFLETPKLDSEKLTKEKFDLDLEKAKNVISAIIDMLENISEENFTAENIKEESVKKIEALGVKNGFFLWPFRVALSGRERSAPPFDICEVIGKEASLKRLQSAI